MIRPRLPALRSTSRLTSLDRSSHFTARNPSRSYSSKTPSSPPSKSSNFGILLLLSALAGSAGYLYAVSSRELPSSKSFLPVSSLESRYSYTRDLSPPNLPHQYGSEKDFNRAIAEIKGYFSATSSGDPGDQYDDYVSEEETELTLHGHDEIGHDADTKKPNCVVFARSIEDVVKIVQISNKYKMPIVPFGGGTSLESHFTCPYGGISLDLSNMNKIKELHAQDGDMVVEAGCRWEDINAWLDEQGHDLFFPLDPGPGATIGGMIGTGGSGTNAVRYGTARNGVILNLTAVLPSGEVIKTRSRARKSSAGPDLTSLFTGAEGTLGVIVEATIRLYPKLPISVAYCSFSSVSDACSAVRDIIMAGAPLQCIELLDANMLKATNEAGISTKRYEEKDSLFIKLSGSEIAMDDAAKTINKIVKKYGTKKLEFAKSEKEMEELWNARKNALWSAKGMVESGRVWTTDSCVPISSLPSFIKFAQEEIQSSGLKTSIVSHSGDGNVHCFLGLNDDSDTERAKVSVQKLAEKAIELGGTCTGEHSIGNGKKQHLKSELGEGTLRLLKALKLQIDPLNLFNPGKLYPEKIDEGS